MKEAFATRRWAAKVRQPLRVRATHVHSELLNTSTYPRELCKTIGDFTYVMLVCRDCERAPRPSTCPRDLCVTPPDTCSVTLSSPKNRVKTVGPLAANGSRSWIFSGFFASS